MAVEFFVHIIWLCGITCIYYGGHLEIQYRGHVTSSPLAPYVCISNRTKVMAKKRFGLGRMAAILKCGTRPEINPYTIKYLCAKFGAFIPICTILLSFDPYRLD
jgi:hypothetical protein